MGLLMQWALLVLVGWAQLLVGELKSLGLPTSAFWAMVCPGQGSCTLRHGSRRFNMP